jgi:hypothetical protein
LLLTLDITPIPFEIGSALGEDLKPDILPDFLCEIEPLPWDAPPIGSVHRTLF